MNKTLKLEIVMSMIIIAEAIFLILANRIARDVFALLGVFTFPALIVLIIDIAQSKPKVKDGTSYN